MGGGGLPKEGPRGLQPATHTKLPCPRLGTQCSVSWCSGQSGGVRSGAPCVGSSCQWPLPSAGGSQGVEGSPPPRPGPAWGDPGTRRPRAAFGLSAVGPQSRNEAVGAAPPRGPAGSLSSSVCWCVRRETEGARATAGGGLCTIHHRKRTRWLRLVLGAPRGQSTSTEARPYKGPLNWFPDRCCRMEGLELAASPSFRQTTCGRGRAVSAEPTRARPPAPGTHTASGPSKSPTSPEPWGREGKLRPRGAEAGGSLGGGGAQDTRPQVRPSAAPCWLPRGSREEAHRPGGSGVRPSPAWAATEIARLPEANAAPAL